MKRRMIATAMFGTLFIGLANLASADECHEVDSHATMQCRQLPPGNLGNQYCLVPEGLGLRGVNHSGSMDPWTTAQTIRLGNVPVPGSGSAAPCPQHHVDLSGAKLNITANGAGHYKVSIRGSVSVDVNDATVQQDQGSDVWLSGTDSTNDKMHYYIFFRDKLNGDKLPKFLIVEALDFADGNCGNNAPSLEKNTVVRHACVGSSASKGGGGSEPEVKETGVGGGGEGGKHS